MASTRYSIEVLETRLEDAKTHLRRNERASEEWRDKIEYDQGKLSESEARVQEGRETIEDYKQALAILHEARRVQE